MRTPITLALLAALNLPVAALADDHEDDEVYRPYTTTNIYNVTPDFSNLDSAIALGQSAGYPIPGVPGLAIELDLLITLFGGENSGGDNGNAASAGFPCTGTAPVTGAPTPPGCNQNFSQEQAANDRRERQVTDSSDDFRMLGYGLFASYRTPGSFFFAAKVGVNGFNTNIREIEDEGGGLSWKAGVGYEYRPGTLVQLQYFKLNDVVDGFGLGLRYGFDDVF